MPRDPQGAGTRTETRVEWRNVYDGPFGVFTGSVTFQFRPLSDAYAEAAARDGCKRIAVEEVTTVTTITRHPIPPHAGEETKG